MFLDVCRPRLRLPDKSQRCSRSSRGPRTACFPGLAGTSSTVGVALESPARKPLPCLLSSDRALTVWR
eukprot:5479504-Pyramimonas_sp.AAC.1